MLKRLFSVVLFVLSFVLSTPLKACEVALALTVDISGSVDREEYALQMNGLAGALRDPTVSEALVSRKAKLMLVQWTGTSRQIISVPWRQISDYDDIEAMAEAVEKAPRAWRNFSTAIGDALTFTSAQFEKVSDCKRKVIDVSGDGYSNEGVEPLGLRNLLAEDGFTINGLAIEGSADDLTSYYRDHVIAGNGSFVMTANTFDEYPKRIKQKLFREVTNQVASLTVYDKAL
jgi:Ca-activated chloride channel family protein